MTDGKLFKIGATGAVLAALCCFTPLLAVALAAMGLAAAIAWIDFVALPLLVLFLGMIVVAVYRQQFGRPPGADGS